MNTSVLKTGIFEKEVKKESVPAVDRFFAKAQNREKKVQIHLAHPKLEARLKHELESKKIPLLALSGRMFVTPALEDELLFAGTTWTELEFVKVDSVKNTVHELRNRNRDWGLYSIAEHTRAALIQEQLPQKRHTLLNFPTALPGNPVGGWTLLNASELLLSRQTTSPFPNGIPHFEENHTEPPSRAYLKLWELFTRFPQLMPNGGEKVVDMGACPGGWSWVLANLGCRVTSVDKAPLAENVMKRVDYRDESAFGILPGSFGKVTLFCSDIICYPARLLELVKRWNDSGMTERFICSVKFQGETDYAILDAFKKIPNARIVHLFQNGHEVTFFTAPEKENIR